VFRPCPEPVVVTLRLLVDERETVLSTCLGHADWLSDYAEEDPAVRFADGVPAAPLAPLPREGTETLT
jgi:hypothetical protein